MTKKFLEKNDLMAVQMDKANGFAIMPKGKYNQKMEDILRSKQFEKWLPKRKNAMDPVLSLEEKLNASLKGLMKAGKISEILYKEVFSS